MIFIIFDEKSTKNSKKIQKKNSYLGAEKCPDRPEKKIDPCKISISVYEAVNPDTKKKKI